MALSASNVLVNPGTLTWDGVDLGTLASEVRIFPRDVNRPIITESFGDMPIDFVFSPGPVYVSAFLAEWTATMRQAWLGDHRLDNATPASSTGVIFGTQDVSGNEVAGRKLSTLFSGTLAWTAAAGTGYLKFSASRAVPVAGILEPVEIPFSRKEETRYAAIWCCLPPVAGGTAITIDTTS